MRTPWAGDWPGRLAGRLSEFDCDSMREFVASRQGKTFEQLARELAPDVAPAQVQMMYLKESRDSGLLLEAAAECLARTIIERFPRGWGVGGRLDYRTSSALAAWVSDMLHDIEQSTLDRTILNGIADALHKCVSPPEGWLPKSGEDPHIQHAFKIGLGGHQS